MKPVVVIDYGVGNITSVIHAISFLGYEGHVSSESEKIRQAHCLVLPGVGAFSEAMKNLRDLRLIEVLHQEVIEKKKPILGICLGMQVMAKSSEENGIHSGLGWIEGEVRAFSDHYGDLKIPHVGWTTVAIKKKSPLFNRISDELSFYFDHSYYLDCNMEEVAAKSDYGISFVSAIQKDNIFGVQFHPEKSQTAGLKLFRSFFHHALSKNYRDSAY